MDRKEAFDLVLSSLKKATNIESTEFTESTDLVADRIIDSLDSMTLIFEIEQTLEKKLAIDEEFEEFKIALLIDLIIDAVKK